ncbi:hypothetical protein HAP47_0009050 [Bradyrhizobium sp. 41S5]|uniref:DUF6966 domain-containing protein n=1 Tax=Bradyrhizobium sp. 41S5 TaxID=1404443 RepID=UPI00156BD5E9|nr:hypothetical protein [Bradyrhizobium sp. 41S5]UFX46796.1 hypothetical protein HAP47_0009050 [Bradyrhizobium sp. 41S5]
MNILPSPSAAVPELITILGRLVVLLREDEWGSHWADWMEISRREIAGGDFHGIERLLSAYGGMGSFNDLVLSSSNDELDRLRTRAGALAILIRNNADIAGS